MQKLISLVVILLLMGCEPAPDADSASKAETHAGSQAGITWFDGSVDEAFKAADQSGKPLFLYWGAVWCPPCQEIKHTVFKSQEFINLSRLFVPVYLDGDTDRAQAWGEKFGVQGYPTMIVFNPRGEEVTRIPGGIDISRYNTVLQLSLNKVRSTSALVQLALDNPGQISADEFYQLAYYSWFQDAGAVPEGTDRAQLFLSLSNNAPAGELSDRFFMNYLLALTEDEGARSPDQFAQQRVHQRLVDILADDQRILATWDTLAYAMEEILALPEIEATGKQALSIRWADSVYELRFAESLSTAERLAGWLPKLQLLTKDDAEISSELQGELSAEMQAVNDATPDSFERQSVINQVGYVYREAGMLTEARTLLLEELERSASPYYFMSSLGSLAEKEGYIEEAVEWRRKAYENAVGDATRFQWGSNYVLAMIRMTPENSEMILAQSLALVNEFEEAGELFAGRNFRTLRQLNEKLSAWKTDQELETLEFVKQIKQYCDARSADSMEYDNCRSLFEEKPGADENLAQAS